MPLISMYERDNSRAVYRMLSERAVEQFDTQTADEIDRLPFKSLARLLEHYRYDAFSDRDPIGVLDGIHPALNERHIRSLGRDRAKFADVREALESAQVTVFGQTSKDEVVEFLQRILVRLMASAASTDSVSAEDRARGKQFFAAFSQALSAPR